MIARVLAGLAALIAATGAGLAWNGLENPPDEAGYIFAEVQQRTLKRSIMSAGALEPVNSVEVSSQLSGQIASLEADYNQMVTRGQVLARLDAAGFQARVDQLEAQRRAALAEVNLEQAAVTRAAAEKKRAEAEGEGAAATGRVAQARLESAARNLKRVRKLLDRRVASDRDGEEATLQNEIARGEQEASRARQGVAKANLTRADADLNVARAQLEKAQAELTRADTLLEAARLDLDRTHLRAPIDGMIIKRDVDLGQTVAATFKAPSLFTIVADLRRMRVNTFVDEADIGLVRAGQRAVFTVEAYPGRSFQGLVEQVRQSPRRSQNVVTYSVVIGVENPDLALLPGMTAIVRLMVEENRNTLAVASAALRFTPDPLPTGTVAKPVLPVGEGGLWVEDARGSVGLHRVSTGLSDGEYTAVSGAGLQEGSRVVLRQSRPPGQTGWLDRIAGLWRD